MDEIKGVPGIQPYHGHKQNPTKRQKKEQDSSDDRDHYDEEKKGQEERAHNVIPNLIASSIPLFNEMEGEALEPPLHEPVANAVHHYQETKVPHAKTTHPHPLAEDQEGEGGGPLIGEDRAEGLSIEEMISKLTGLEASLHAVNPDSKSLSMLFEQMEQAEEMAREAVGDANQKMLHLAMHKASVYLGEMAEHLGELERTAETHHLEYAYLDYLNHVLDHFVAASHKVQSVGVKATLDAPDVFELENPDPIETVIGQLPHIREG